MRYIFDNDLHLHSKLSLCSNDPEQTPQAILDYAVANKLTDVCLTDHYWDETVKVPYINDFYARQDYAHVAESLPLPRHERVRFMFGVETDLDKNLTLGISPENYDKFDFIVIPTTHLHMNGFTCRGDESAEERAKLWIERFDAVLSMELPFHKVGIAHLTCSLMYPKHPTEEVLDLIPDAELHRLFRRAAEVGAGIELNVGSEMREDNTESILRPYRAALAEGCKFYFASDAHHPSGLAGEAARAEKMIGLLELTEDDKFRIC